MIARLFPILGITFVDILGFSILIPIMPYYVKHFGAPDVVVGVLFAAFAFCQFLAGPLWGAVSDRVGRKRVLIISQVGATIGWAGLAFAPTLVWVFVARIVEGISGGNISVTQAYVADRVEPSERSRAFATVGAAFSAGLVLGPAIGGVLLRYGYAAPFLCAAGLQVVTLALTWFFLPESVAEKGEVGESASLGDILRFLRDPGLSPLLVQKLASSLGMYAWFASFSLVLQTLLHFDATQTSYAYAGFGIVSVVVQIGVVGRVAERLGARVTSNVGFVALLAFFAAMPFVHGLAALVLVLPFFAVGLAFVNATLATLLTDASPDRIRGTVLGVGSSLDSVAGVISPAPATELLALYAVPGPAALAFGFIAVALGLGIRAQRREAPGTAHASPS